MFRFAITCALAVCILGASLPRTRIDKRIVGGHDTSIDKHPYQVSLIIYKNRFCGGSLIAKNWVLTAAHCLGDGKVTVRVGSSSRVTDGVLHEVKSKYRHSNYYNITHDYDYGLLELEKPVTISKNVNIIKLVDQQVELKPDIMMTVTGWGLTEEGGSGANILQEVQVPYIDQKTCSKFLKTTARMFCAGYLEVGGKSFCSGDSGGPIVANGIQYGVVSWSGGCARPKYPGVYAKISAVRSWIKEISGV